MLSRVTPARAAARSWAMTAATAASIRRVSLCFLGQPGAADVLAEYALPIWRASRESPEGTVALSPTASA